MRKWPSIVLVLAFLIGLAYNSILWVDFKMAQEYYAAELCEQRQIEDNDCQGQCQLKAILMGEEQGSKAPIVPNYSEEQLDFLNEESSQKMAFNPRSSDLKIIPYLNSSELAGYAGLSWKPPQV